MKNKKKKEAAFFDLDGTLVSKPSEKDFCFQLFLEGQVNIANMLHVATAYVKYDAGIVKNYSKTKTRIIELLMRDMSKKYVNKRFHEYFESNLKKHISNVLVKALSEHKKAGRKIIVISSTLDFIVKEFCEYLGISEYYSCKLEVKDGCYTGKLLNKILYGETKRELIDKIAIQQNIDLSNSYAYGDSVQDGPMLKSVGNAFVVNPGKKFSKLAKKRSGWSILYCN